MQGATKIVAVLAVLLAWSSAVSAATWANVTIDCKLLPVTVLADENGRLAPQKLDGADSLHLTFTGFDETNNKAMLVGNMDRDEVLFYDVMGHAQIIQITPTANVSTTTISIEGDSVRAVHSRHMRIGPGGGVYSIYQGPCALR